jgi:hypothetical protein
MKTGRDHFLIGIFTVLPIIAVLSLSVAGCLSNLLRGAK